MNITTILDCRSIPRKTYRCIVRARVSLFYILPQELLIFKILVSTPKIRWVLRGGRHNNVKDSVVKKALFPDCIIYIECTNNKTQITKCNTDTKTSLSGGLEVLNFKK